ncbi:MAG: Ig-like domain-containing protein [Solirubrobacterales bacterium]|nr:Ig-like domain-containing protein [Solirubrobacterales bacterium]
MNGQRRIAARGPRIAMLILILAGFAGLGFTSAAQADLVANPGNSFAATVTGGELKVGSDLDPIDVAEMSPSPRLRNVTVNADGTLTAAPEDFVFPQLTLSIDTPIGKKDIFIQLRAAQPVTGSIDPVTGATELHTALTIQLTSNDSLIALGNNCYVGTPSNPIQFNAYAAADDSKGVHYDQYSGEVQLIEDTLEIPAATGCPTILGQNVNEIANTQLGLPSPSGNNLIRLEMRFKAPTPHSEDWIDPEGPGHIDPVIVNDTEVTNSSGTYRSWLESLAITNNTRYDSFDNLLQGVTYQTGRKGNTVRISLLVKHDPGRSVTGLKIDDDWNATDDSDGATAKVVSSIQPVVQGGFNYSRITFDYLAPTAGMGVTCPNAASGNGPGTNRRVTKISVRAVLDNDTESNSSQSDIAISREDCDASRPDGAMFYGWEPQVPGPVTAVTPGTPVTFKFRGVDTDTIGSPLEFGGFNFRFRNLDTGQVSSFPNPTCTASNQDDHVQTLNLNAPGRGRWVLEGEPLSHPEGLFDPKNCSRREFADYWYWIGAIDVNSPQELSGTYSPEVTLNVPARPGVDGSLPISVETRDALDLNPGPSAAQGKTQLIEWDLDGDDTNGVDGFETTRLGDSETGMGPGQNQRLIDTSEMEPGIYPVRVRVGDNGALGAADEIRRTTVSDTKTYMVNTPPSANGLSVTTDYGKSVATPLVAADTNADSSHDPLTWTMITPPAHGYLAGEWPNRVFHPDSGYSGPDSFTYRVDDGFGGSATATVSITVKAKPADPVDPGPDPDNPKRDHLKASFPEGRMNLNEAGGPSTSGVKVVDSAVPDPPVVFETDHWNKTTGEINAPATDLKFPSKSVQMSVTDPIPLDLDVKIEFGAIGNITGNYSQSTGAMKLNFNAHALITITAGGGNLRVMTCDVTPIPLAFSSAGADLVDPGETGKRPARNWKAKAFSPPSRDGAITSLWNSLPASKGISEPMAPTASCGGTLDSLIGGKGGFWLGGKVSVAGSTNPDPPNGSTVIFDGKRLHLRLKCGPQYRPACNMVAVPVTAKDRKTVRKIKRGKKVKRIVKIRKGKPMARPLRKKIKAGKWIRASFLIKPQYRAKVLAMSRKKSKQLYVQQKVKSKKLGKKKFKGKKPRIVYHRYRVRSAG